MDTNLFALWPIVPFGGEDEKVNQATNDDGSQGNSAPEGESKQDPPEGKQDKDSDDDDDDDDEYKGYSAKELRRIAADNAKKAKAAEKEVNKHKAAQDAEERKKNDDVTNLTKDVSDRDATITTLRTTMTKQAITGSIRDDSRYEWNDVEIVAGLLDPEVVKVSDEGKVEGLKTQLTKVAKEHPFLLKKDNTGDGKNNGQQGGQQNNGGPTGFQPGQGGAGNGGQEVDRKKLAEDYPALASRI